MSLLRDAREPPVVAIDEDAALRLCRSWRSPLSTTAATRCAPALPELAIAAEHDGGDPLRPGSAGAGDRR
ncbi:hypothetical protein MAHJHV50_50600 [Mycobacterium avium subsp. hominissuis]